MSGQPLTLYDGTPPSSSRGQVAAAEIVTGSRRLRLGVAVTPVGLLAVGALVSSILLATTVLVGATLDRSQRR